MTKDLEANPKSTGKKPYRAPRLFEHGVESPAVLLLCTGQYNCVNEAGYDCCQPDSSTCFTNC